MQAFYDEVAFSTSAHIHDDLLTFRHRTLQGGVATAVQREAFARLYLGIVPGGAVAVGLAFASTGGNIQTEPCATRTYSKADPNARTAAFVRAALRFRVGTRQ